MRKIFLSVFLAIVLIGVFVWVGQRESRIEAQTLYRETRGIVLKYLEKISNPTDDVIQFESQGGTYNENLKLNLDGNNTVTISSGSGVTVISSEIGITLDDGSGASPSLIFKDEADETVTFSKGNSTMLSITTQAADGINILGGNLKIGNATPTNSLDGEDLYVEGNIEVDGTADIAGNTTVSGTLYGAPFMMVITKDGQYTSSVANLTTFQMPFKATVIEVSVCARDIDTADGDETYTVDIKEGGTTILNSTMNITADNTVVVGTLDDTTLADNAKITVDLTLGGTSPALDDLTILMTLKRAP